MKITIIGTGYVGLVTGTCLAEMGNTVICIDNDKKKIDMLRNRRVPIYEPGLEELIKKNEKKKRLSFSTSIEKGVRQSDIIFICVNTPPKPDGEAEMCYVESVAREVARVMRSYKIIVDKSTVPVGTGEWIKHTVKIFNKKKIAFDIVSNPEFLREGSAIQDFMKPDRIVVGTGSEKARSIMLKLYAPLKSKIIFTDIKSAEIIKHACNSFLATKISYINAISRICEHSGADVEKVAEGMGMDKRIGKEFLNAGLGFGGSCFPKDLSAFIRIAEKSGYDFSLLKVVHKINEDQKEFFLKKMKDTLWNLKGKTVAVLGLAFKQGTDDLRNAPSIQIIKSLQKEEARIKAYDPVAMKKAREIFKGIVYCRDAYEASRDSDVLIILTEWEEFIHLDFNRIKKLLKTPIIIDGRNMLDPSKMKSLGFIYKCMGRT